MTDERVTKIKVFGKALKTGNWGKASDEMG